MSRGSRDAASSRPPVLYLIADRAYLGSDEVWLERIRDVADAVASSPIQYPDTFIQLRAKEVTGDGRGPLLERALALAKRAGAPVLLNGSVEEAESLRFDGVHWPEAAIPEGLGPVKTGAAASPGGKRWRAASVHSTEAADRALAAGAHFSVFGPVYAPGSKVAQGVGLGPLAQLAARTPMPIVAIGGISSDRVKACLAAGAAGVAVVSTVFGPQVDPASAVAELCEQLTLGPDDSG